MNREIKFRGKGERSKKWIYGSLKAQTEHDISCQIWDKEFLLNDVQPYTIGQYTGLKDKNGKEVYEGDIVSSGATTGIVVYDCEQAGFVVQKEKSIELRFYSLVGIEVIGNIHDNPELLKQQQQ